MINHSGPFMNNAKVSIVVPCYKKAQYLAEALDSILSQSYSEWECVIVNDGSPDHTEEVAMRFCKLDSRFKYLSQPNQGVSAARNNGIRLMDGKYILALDADDWVSSTYVEKAVDCLEKFPDVKLVYSRYESFGKTGKKEWIQPEYSYERFVMGDVSIVCSALYRRADFERVGGYDINMQGFEDWDFWLSLLNSKDKVYRIDEVLFHYRFDSSIITKQVAENEKYYRSLLCKKHEDVYKNYFVDVLFFYGKWREYEDLYANERAVRSSHAYRLGKFLLKPFSWIIKGGKT